MAADQTDRDSQVRAAFDRAVSRELSAIARHDATALVQDATAARMELQAGSTQDDARRAALTTMATRNRQRAGRARGRAETARQRLIDEGVDVDPVAPAG